MCPILESGIEPIYNSIVKRVLIACIILFTAAGAGMADNIDITDNRFDKREKNAQLWSFAAGVAAGIGLDVLYAFTMFTGFEDIGNPGAVAAAVTATSLMQIATAGASTFWIAYLFTSLEIPRVWSVPAGLAAGAVTGALAGALTIGTLFAISVPTGIIILNEREWIDTWWESFAYFGIRAAMFGALYGAIAGCIEGAVLSFSLKW